MTDFTVLETRVPGEFVPIRRTHVRPFKEAAWRLADRSFRRPVPGGDPHGIGVRSLNRDTGGCAPTLGVELRPQCLLSSRRLSLTPPCLQQQRLAEGQ